MAVDAATGRHKWTRVIAGSAGASGRPAIAGGDVMAASRDGTIHAFDAESGEPRWVWPGVPRLSTELDYRPLASDARLVVAGSLSGEVVAHDIVSRRVVWRRTPAVASVAFDLLVHRGIAYVPFYSGQVVALRLRDGVELWRVGGGPDRFTWVPAVDNADVVVSGARTLVLFRRSVAVPRGEGR
jgi:outer membrane protein assembly factor BamB